jgi:HEAT repeat protein
VPLAEALARPDQPLLVRRSLAAALTSAAHPDAQPVLLTALADPDPQVRGYAARALGHIGNEVAYERLAELLADRSPLLKGTVGDEARTAREMMERRGRRAAPIQIAPEEAKP